MKNRLGVAGAAKSLLMVALLALATIISPFKNVVAHATADTVYSDATQVNVDGDDDYSDAIDIPFDFTFYGNTFNQLYVSTNGVVSFDNPSDEYDNADLSGGGIGNNSIYAFWDDLDSQITKNIYYKTVGTEGSRKFIIQYTDHQLHYEANEMPFGTVQVILTEGSNTIQLQYSDLARGDLGLGKSATIGISDGTNYKQFSHNTASLSERKAILYTPDGGSDYTQNASATYDAVRLNITDAPTAATLAAPANGAVGVSTSPTLSWTAGTNNDGLYRVIIATSSDFSDRTTVDNFEVTGTSTEPESGLRASTVYYWVVKAYGNDAQAFSSVGSFTTGPGVTHNIANCDDLQNMDVETGTSDTFYLTQDIDCTDIENFVPIGSNWGAPFNGTLDGRGHSISNLNIAYESGGNVGLFAESDDAYFKNINIDGGSVSNTSGSTGALIGFAQNTDLLNVTSSADVTSDDYAAGGLVGYYELDESSGQPTLSHLSSSGAVTGGYLTGGLFGEFDVYDEQTAVIQKSSFTGTATSDSYYVGGLIGYAYVENDNYDELDPASLTIQNSYSTADVTGYTVVGGIVGAADNYNDGYDSQATISLDSVYSSGAVEATSGDAGGLVGIPYGLNYDYTELSIANSFVTGPVAGSGSWGMVGSSDYIGDGTFSSDNNYLDISNSNQDYPFYSESVGGWESVNLEDAEPDYFLGNHTEEPMASWNFNTIWKVNADALPTLQQNDVDTDGIDDAIENAGPNSGDANNDGISDNSQQNVASFVNDVTGQYTVLQVSGDCSIVSVTAAAESANTTQDTAYSYPGGLLNFQVNCGSSGATAVVTQYYYGVDATDLIARKYNESNQSYTTIADAVISAVTIDGHSAAKVVYNVTDGGELDADGEANGIIVDPSGVAKSLLGAPNTGLGGL